jgi:hypothetical protein
MVTDSGLLSGPASPEVIMNHAYRVGRWLANLSRHTGFLLACHEVVPAVAANMQPRPPRWSRHSPLSAPARPVATSGPRVGARPQARPARPHAMAAPTWLPHTFQLCIHCRENPAGFWVSRTGDKTARRPWCLCCCQGLDRHCCEIIAFGG